MNKCSRTTHNKEHLKNTNCIASQQFFTSLVISNWRHFGGEYYYLLLS